MVVVELVEEEDVILVKDRKFVIVKLGLEEKFVKVMDIFSYWGVVLKV